MSQINQIVLGILAGFVFFALLQLVFSKNQQDNKVKPRKIKFRHYRGSAKLCDRSFEDWDT